MTNLAETSSSKQIVWPLTALGIDSLGIQSLKALATYCMWLRAEGPEREKPAALAEGVFTGGGYQVFDAASKIKGKLGGCI